MIAINENPIKQRPGADVDGVTAADIRRADREWQVLKELGPPQYVDQKGDRAGHEFHGNQWTDGGGVSADPIVLSHALTQWSGASSQFRYGAAAVLNVDAPGYHAGSVSPVLRDQSLNLLRAVRDGEPSNQPLYRGMVISDSMRVPNGVDEHAFMNSLSPGMNIDLPLAGFSKSLDIADAFSGGDMRITLEKGATSVDVGGAHSGESEVVTGGRFEVVSLKDALGHDYHGDGTGIVRDPPQRFGQADTRDPAKFHYPLALTLRQVATFNPDAAKSKTTLSGAKWKPYLFDHLFLGPQPDQKSFDIALQAAAMRRWGGTLSGDLLKSMSDVGDNEEFDHYLSASYMNFQAAALRAGVQDVTLYRGFLGDVDELDVVISPLSSWTADPDIAQAWVDNHDGKVYIAQVPVQRIVGIGDGPCEVIVIGSTLPLHVKAWNPDLHPRDEHGRFGQISGDAERTTLKSRPSDLLQRARAGGFTMSTTGTSPTDGYIVAHQGDSVIVPSSVVNDPEKFSAIVTQAIHDFGSKGYLDQPGAHIGGWLDHEHGEFVLDPVEHVQDRNEAIKLGVQRNQQAIYDVAAGEEISTGGTGDRKGVHLQNAQEEAQGASDAQRQTDGPLPRSQQAVVGDERSGARGVRESDRGEDVPGRSVEIKGDKPGHEFHGNQWTGGRGGNPDADKSPALRKALHDLESNSGYNHSPIEHAQAFRPDGTPIFTPTSHDVDTNVFVKDAAVPSQFGLTSFSNNEVALTPEQSEAMRGSIFTHCHPDASGVNTGSIVLGGRSFGGSLSIGDMQLAHATQLAEIRSVDEKYTYSMKPSDGYPFSSMTREMRMFYVDAQGAEGRAYIRGVEAARDNGVAYDDRERFGTDAFLKEVHNQNQEFADRFGYTYTRTEHG